MSYYEEEQTPPKTLYHYTTNAGLLGIIEHKCLWMTHRSFLNDGKEGLYGKELVERYRKKMSCSIATTCLENWLASFEGRSDDALDRRFIGCFSEDGDLLSQWRAYSEDGAGVALGFNFAELNRLAEDVRWCTCPNPIDYDRNSQEGRVEAFFSKDPNIPTENRIRFWMSQFEDCCTFFKCDAFSEEKEWRMATDCTSTSATPGSESQVPGPKFRLTKYGLSPYVELSFPNNAISEIFVGPRSSMRDKHWVLEALLQENGFTEIPTITNSRASYR